MPAAYPPPCLNRVIGGSVNGPSDRWIRRSINPSIHGCIDPSVHRHSIDRSIDGFIDHPVQARWRVCRRQLDRRGSIQKRMENRWNIIKNRPKIVLKSLKIGLGDARGAPGTPQGGQEGKRSQTRGSWHQVGTPNAPKSLPKRIKIKIISRPRSDPPFE